MFLEYRAFLQRLSALVILSISVSALADEPSLAVMELPPTEGSDQAQVAVKWSGELPVTLQAGVASGQEGFEPIGKQVVLTEAMSLIAHPGQDGDEVLSWRVLDQQSRTLAHTRGSSAGFGWQPGFHLQDLDNAVVAETIFQDELIVGGQFTSASEVSVNHIARWDGSAWAALSGPSGTGVNNRVQALTVYNGELIAGGFFTQAGGVTVNRIARWDGTDWAALSGPSGTGVNGRVQALSVYNGELIAGGEFTQAGGVTVNRIARWDGSAWAGLNSSLGTGVNNIVWALSVYDGELIAGGNFTQAGGVTVNHIARWDGGAWSGLSGVSGTGVNATARALTVYSGELIVGGDFTQAGGVTVNRIARWDGTAWAALSGPSGTGVNSRVQALSVYNGELIAGGFFSQAGGVTVNSIARWDGSAWADLSGPAGTGVNNNVLALSVYNGGLIAGGDFTWAGGVTVNRIARWDGSAWDALSAPSGNGVNATVRALSVYNGELIAGGDFTQVGGITVNLIARWDGSDWSALSGPSGTGVNASVRALSVYNGELIVGGFFSQAGGVTVNRIARWDGSAWAGLSGPAGTGVNNSVVALSVYSGELIAGGFFSQAGGVTVNYIARWDGSGWAGLIGSSGNGVSSPVAALNVYSGELIAGGYFIQAGGVTVNRIARWDGSGWVPLSGPSGTGVDNPVLALSAYNGELIAGGDFTQAGGVTVNRIARWDGTAWAALSGPSGTGVNSRVQALSVYNGELIAGGFFSQAGGVTVNNIARWDGSAWADLSGPTGTGVNNAVRALSVYNSELIAGGDFAQAGGIPSVRIGRYITPYTIGGEVTDLAGGTLVLQNNGGDDLALSSNGAFTFSTPLANGNGYTVTVLTQPSNPSQTCSIANGSGTVGGTDVTDIEVTCTTDKFTVGGEVSGLDGDQVVLQNEGGDDQIITANGSFTFSPQDDATSYDVTILIQPSDPSQTCTVTNGSGNLAGTDVTNIDVTCVTDQFTIGGTVSDLEGSGLVLQNNNGDDLAISANGTFTFPTALNDLSAYSVSVLTQPSDPSQTCTVANGSGNLAGTDVTNVDVTCVTDQFTIGGTVSDLEGSGLVLQNNNDGDLSISADGPFTFPTALDDLSAYSVTVLSQPSNPSQSCSISNDSGNLAGADVTNVDITCTTDQFTVGGEVSGLAGDQVVLQNEGSDDQIVTTNSSFTFSPQDDSTSYDVTVLTQPDDPSQTCTVLNGTGTLTGENVINVEVTCVTDQFTVGGTVTGLEGDQVVLQNNGGDDQTLTADGGFLFSPQDDATDYQVAVATQPSDPQQVCNVIAGSGTLAGADVGDVEVICGGPEVFNDRFEVEQITDGHPTWR